MIGRLTANRLPLEGGGRCANGLDRPLLNPPRLQGRAKPLAHRVGVSGPYFAVTPVCELAHPHLTRQVRLRPAGLSSWRVFLPPSGGGERLCQRLGGVS